MYTAVETEFGLNMLRNAPVNDSLVVSPISVIFALAMVHAGAKGSTKSQISSIISKGFVQGFLQQSLGPIPESDIEEHYSKLSSQIMNASHGVKSRIANGFFLNKEFQIEKDYEQAVEKKYGAKVEALDFGQAEEAAKVIDDFISKTTDGKIQDMVNAATVEGAYSLIVNAIYFTADWASKFYRSSNSNGTFHSAEGIERQVEYMNDYDVHRFYAEDDDLQVLSLQYADTSFAFNIFLPKIR
ncbi:serine proteinase inhibitor [Cooperia oncophora]